MENFKLHIDKEDRELEGLTIREVMEKLSNGYASKAVNPISDTQAKAAQIGLKVA